MEMFLAQASISQIGLQHYLTLGAVMFVCGLLTIMVKRNAIGILMGVELVLNAANVNLVAFNHFVWSRHPAAAGSSAASSIALDGQIFGIFVIVLAAAEASVALAIFLNYYNNFATIDVERAQNLKG
jgi:NADH:ubiquinone oxidoreductase subunit K